jgi:hypothetical protein
MLKSSITCVAGVALALFITGCRQPDGPLPKPNAEQQNEIGDLSRDILAVAGGDRQAVKDMSDDMAHLDRSETAKPLVLEMNARVARAVAGKKLTAEQALNLANQLYLTFAGTALSGRQVAKIQDDVRTQLTQIGAAQEAVTPVVDQIAAIQKVVTTTQKRWWQIG